VVELSANFCVENAPSIIGEVYLFLMETEHLFGFYFALPLLELDYTIFDGLPLDSFLVADGSFENGHILLELIVGLCEVIFLPLHLEVLPHLVEQVGLGVFFLGVDVVYFVRG
jgi:hypothetical protein